jgi:hypothetical protein
LILGWLGADGAGVADWFPITTFGLFSGVVRGGCGAVKVFVLGGGSGLSGRTGARGATFAMAVLGIVEKSCGTTNGL